MILLTSLCITNSVSGSQPYVGNRQQSLCFLDIATRKERCWETNFLWVSYQSSVGLGGGVGGWFRYIQLLQDNWVTVLGWMVVTILSCFPVIPAAAPPVLPVPVVQTMFGRSGVLQLLLQLSGKILLIKRHRSHLCLHIHCALLGLPTVTPVSTGPVQKASIND